MIRNPILPRFNPRSVDLPRRRGLPTARAAAEPEFPRKKGGTGPPFPIHPHRLQGRVSVPVPAPEPPPVLGAGVAIFSSIQAVYWEMRV